MKEARDARDEMIEKAKEFSRAYDFFDATQVHRLMADFAIECASASPASENGLREERCRECGSRFRTTGGEGFCSPDCEAEYHTGE